MANHPKGLIDIAMRDYDKMDPDDTNFAGTRTAYLGFLQQVYNWIMNYREWPFTYDEQNVTLTSGQDDAAYPTGFISFGRHGGLWDPARKIKLRELSAITIKRLREESTGADSLVFGIFDGRIQFPYTASATTTFRALFRIGPETLADGTTALVLPDYYIQTTLMPAFLVRTQESKQDARDSWKGYTRDGLGEMCRNENPMQTGIGRLPLAVRGAW